MLLLTAVICSTAYFCAAAASGTNLVANPSFETPDPTDNRRPQGWRPELWYEETVRAQLVDGGHSGGRCVMISCDDQKDKGAGQWFQEVLIKPFSKYRFTGWIKTEDVKADGVGGAAFTLGGVRHSRRLPLTGTDDWTKIEIVFDSGYNDSVQVGCFFGIDERATGRAWFDDTSIEMLSTRDPKPSVIVDASTTREPISKYIYGQFIEHLGRCIYGGIWAEMLVDRKFFYPVGAEGSPWSAIGGEGTVRVVKENAYSGEQTPQITLVGGSPRGIVQGDLALLEGKSYVGRVVLAGDAGAAPVQVSLVWADGPAGRQTVTIKTLGTDFAKFPLRFKSGASTEHGKLEIVSTGTGAFKVGAVSLMPADNVKGFRADTLALLKELRSPVYRWPGGNFVSGYNWKDGVGDPDRRPTRENPAWGGLEYNDVGIHEFMELCRLLKAEPYIAVNTGLGDAQSAAEEVEYANGSLDTPMGKWRAQNGHPEPFRVEWWCVGNEMFGGWQLGYMPLEDYVKKHDQVAKLMWSKDPSIKLVAVGAVGDWDETMLAQCADNMNLISEHFYEGSEAGLISHVRRIPNTIRRIAGAHRRYRNTIAALQGKDIRIAMDEWNYWYGPTPYGQIGTRYFMRDALGIAEGLHEYSRQSDIVFMANYAQTVNVIGCIKTTKTAAAFETTGLVLKMYRDHYGTIPVAVAGAPEPLDVAAAWTADRKALTVGVVNPTREKQVLDLKVVGARLSGRGKLWLIANPDEMAYNEPGKPPNVRIEQKRVSGVNDQIEVPPVSVSLYALASR